MLISWAVSKRWYSEWSHSIRHFAQISIKLFRLKKRMIHQGEVEMHKSQLLENSEIIVKLVCSSGLFSFLGFLPSLLSPPSLSSFPQKTFLKIQQLVQLMFSQHTVQTSGTKKLNSFFSAFFSLPVKKEKNVWVLLSLHSSKIKDEKPTKRRVSPHPKMMCHRSKQAFFNLSKPKERRNLKLIFVKTIWTRVYRFLHPHSKYSLCNNVYSTTAYCRVHAGLMNVCQAF